MYNIQGFYRKLVALTVSLAMCGVCCTDKLCAMNVPPPLGGGPNTYNNIQTWQFAIPGHISCGNVLLYPSTIENNLMVALQSGLGVKYASALANAMHNAHGDHNELLHQYNILILGGLDVVLAVAPGNLLLRDNNNYNITVTWPPAENIPNDFQTAINGLNHERTWNPSVDIVHPILMNLGQYCAVAAEDVIMMDNNRIFHMDNHGDAVVNIQRGFAREEGIVFLTRLSAAILNRNRHIMHLNLARHLIKSLSGTHAEFRTSLPGLATGAANFFLDEAWRGGLLNEERYLRANAAIQWFKYALHTEAQIAVLGQIGNINIFLNGAPRGAASLAIANNISCYSLYNPCHSCQTLTWVNNRSGRNPGFRYALRDKNTQNQALGRLPQRDCVRLLARAVYLCTRNNLYYGDLNSWQNVAAALTNNDVYQELVNNQAFVDLLNRAGFQDVEDFRSEVHNAVFGKMPQTWRRWYELDR